MDILARAWPGRQTDYGARRENSHKDASNELVDHLRDIQLGMLVSPRQNLDEAHIMVSSLAYGIEHGPETLGRFVDVLEHLIEHDKRSSTQGKRVLRFAIWPKLEHQVIWGADRSRFFLDDSIKNVFSGAPAMRELIYGNGPSSQKWQSRLPTWLFQPGKRQASQKKHSAWLVFCHIRRIAKFFERANLLNRRLSIEVDEIEPWSGRAFMCKYDKNQTFSLFITTTPINSTILSASHWTTMGFSSESHVGYDQMKHMFDTCIEGRYSFSEPISSSPEGTGINKEPLSDAAVRRTKQFLESPYETIGEYFLLPSGNGWKDWSKAQFIEFYDSCHPRTVSEILRDQVDLPLNS